MTSRRGFILGIGAALAAPAIVKAESLMKIAVLRQELNERTLNSVLSTIWGPQRNLSFYYTGIAWQAIIAGDGEVHIIEHPAEMVHVEAP